MPKAEPKSMLMDLKNNYYTEGRYKHVLPTASFVSPILSHPPREQPQSMVWKGHLHSLLGTSALCAPQHSFVSSSLLYVLLTVCGGCVGKEQ